MLESTLSTSSFEKRKVKPEVKYETLDLDKEFVIETQKIKFYLIEVKKLCDNFDKINSSFEELKGFIKNNMQGIFGILDGHFEEIWGIIKNFPELEYKKHQKYYQQQLLPLLCTPPLNKRIYEKPLGYDGDYLTMEYYYDNDYKGNTSYEKIIHRYTLSIPIGVAIINRFKYIYNKLENLILKLNGDNILISSIGCGPAREIIEFINNNFGASNCIFNCLDFEKRAIESIKHRINKIENEKKTKYRVNLYNHNILQFIKKAKEKCYPSPQQFIYSLGLFDYLDDKIASLLLKVMYSLLADNGTIIISNFLKSISHRAYLEFLGKWYLILRDKEDLLQLVSGINGLKEFYTEYNNDKSIIYLIIKK